jgi:hypothetical protein
MNKTQIRILKNHYQSRWAVLRLNQKQEQKILLLNDQFVTKNLLDGTTLCYECLGEMYQGIIPNLSTVLDDNKYNNLVLINNFAFKYNTLDQITVYLDKLAHRALVPGGRIILSFEHRHLIYNRVEISVNTLLDSWTQSLKNFKLLRMANLLGKSQPGYGDYFFCLEYK